MCLALFHVFGIQNSPLARSNCHTSLPEHQQIQLSPINSLLTCAVITFPSLEYAVCDILQVRLMGMGEGEMTFILLVGACWTGPRVSIGHKTPLSWLIVTPHVCVVFELCSIWINGTVSSEISQVSAKQTSAKLNKNI